MSTWNEYYPRPQMRRDSFLPIMDGWTLNGHPITMPFCPESLLSGYEDELGMSMTYAASFTLPRTFLPIYPVQMVYYCILRQHFDG